MTYKQQNQTERITHKLTEYYKEEISIVDSFVENDGIHTYPVLIVKYDHLYWELRILVCEKKLFGLKLGLELLLKSERNIGLEEKHEYQEYIYGLNDLYSTLRHSIKCHDVVKVLNKAAEENSAIDELGFFK